MWFGGGKTLNAPAECKPIVTQALGKEEHTLCACTHTSSTVDPFVTLHPAAVGVVRMKHNIMQHEY